MVGCAAVQGNTWSHPIGCHLCIGMVTQHRRAVGQAAFTRQVVAGVLEDFQLGVYTHCIIRMGEMGHERNFIHLRQGVQTRPGRTKALGRKTQTVHARVHFQKHTLRHLGLVTTEHVDLRFVVHHMPQVQA